MNSLNKNVAFTDFSVQSGFSSRDYLRQMKKTYISYLSENQIQMKPRTCPGCELHVHAESAINCFPENRAFIFFPTNWLAGANY